MKRLLWSMALAALCTFSVRADDDDFDFPEEPIVVVDEPVVAPTPEEQAAAAEIGLPIDIPYLGTVTLLSFTKDGVSGMRARLPATAKKLELGPLVIDDGWLSELGGKYSYTAQAKLFGQAARIGFTDIVGIKRLPLTISFEPVKPSFTLFPGAQFELSSATLVLEKDKPLQLVAATTLFGQPAEVTFVISQATKTTDVVIALKNVLLKSMFPSLENSPLATAMLSSITLRTTNLVTPDRTKKLEILFEGKADLSGLPREIAGEQTTESVVTGRYDSKGAFFSVQVPDLVIPGAGTVTGAKLQVDLSKKMPTVELMGKADIQIPNVGKFNLDVASVVTKSGVEFAGTVKDVVSYAGITIEHAQIVISSKDKTVTLLGDADITGQKVRISLIKDAKNNISVDGKITDGALIRPFAALNIPGLSGIGLLPTGLKLQKTATGTEFVSTGTVELFGATLDGDLRVKGNVKLLVVKAKAGWKLSDAISPLKGTIFDDIALQHLEFILCSDTYSGDFIDETGAKITVSLKKGMNFVAVTHLSGALAPVAKLTGESESTAITLAGSWNPSPFSVSCNAQVPSKINLQFIELDKLLLEIAMNQDNPTPSIALLTQATARPGGDVLLFTVRIKVSPTEALLAGSMQGVWSKPFGIGGIDVGNLALQVDFNRTPPLPAINGSLCIGGQLAKGEPRCSQAERAANAEKLCKDGFGGCIAVKFPDVLSGETEKLMLADILQIALKMIGQKLDASQLPEIGLEDVKIYIVPRQTSIGEFNFEKGFNVTGRLKLLGVDAFLGASVLSSGVILKGSIEPIDFKGLLKVTGKGGTGKAQVDVEITLARQKFLIDGEIALASFFKSGSKIEVSKDGLRFDFESSMGDAVYTDPATQKKQPLLLAQVKGQSSGGLTSPQFVIEIIFQQYLKKYITEQTVNGLRVAERAVDEGIKSAQREIDKINSATREVNEKMQDARNKLESAKRALASIQGAKKKVTDAMASAQRDVDSIRGEITSLDRWYAGLRDVC